MTPPQLQALRPEHVDRSVHQTLSAKLSALILEVAAESVITRPRIAPGLAQLRLRDWDLVRKDGQLVCEIYLDKGQSWLQYDDFKDRPGHLENSQIVSIDECVAIHKGILMRPEIIDIFSDDVQFEVGSAGEEPPLRSADDFLAAVGLMVRIETWTNASGRAKQRGRLIQVDQTAPEHFVIRIEPARNAPSVSAQAPETDTPRTLESFALDDIRRAALLLFDPGNFAKA
jgi:ribosome maturation factor RimP